MSWGIHYFITKQKAKIDFIPRSCFKLLFMLYVNTLFVVLCWLSINYNILGVFTTQDGGHFENFVYKILLNQDFWGLFFIVVSGYLDNFLEKFSFLHFFSKWKSNAPALRRHLITLITKAIDTTSISYQPLWLCCWRGNISIFCAQKN